LNQPKDYKAIMLSSTFTDLKEHRQRAIETIYNLGYMPRVMEYSGAQAEADVIETSLAMVRDTIAYIGVIGLKYGHIPFDSQLNPNLLSMAELEFEEARRVGHPLLLFVMDDDHPVRRADVESVSSSREKLDAFRARLQREFYCHSFGSLEQFSVALTKALQDLDRHLKSMHEYFSENIERVKGSSSEAAQPAPETIDEIEPTKEPSPLESPKALPPTPSFVLENFQTAPFYSDHAARSDLLNRKAVAETVATMIENVWRDADKEESIDRTFMVHLHGRWGSGKTSILNFLKESLLAQNSSGAANRSADPSWIVIDYNAWRNQTLGPAWWTLMETVYRQARQQLGGWWTETGQRLILRDRLWRLRSSYAPYALMAALLIALGLLLIFIWKDTLLGSKSFMDEGVKFIISIVGLVATVFAFGHSYPIGSARTAKSYLELSRDPLNPLIKRYGDLVEDIGRPVAVFIDDLDRCNAAFVVELLQTIQTLFRNARVLYVVAADRDWVCASYQQIYKPFNETIGEPGKSLGHLFVEKVFQLSVEVPRLNELERNRYWEELIKSNLPAAPEIQQKLVEEATRAIEGAQTESAIIKIVDAYRNEPGVAQIVAAKAFRQMQAAPVEKERQHFLNKYASLIEPNPRAMKRLLNAYGFRRGFDIQSRHRSDPDALVRWTILENRWPILADYLEGRIAGNAIIEALIKDKAVLEVANGLTWDKLRPVASAPDEPPKPETTPGTAKK
jgi:hypothetical protein